MNMIRKIHKLYFLAFGALILLLSCPNPVESLDKEDDVAGFKAFYLSPDQNYSINEVVIGEIEEDSVLLVVPGNSNNSSFCPSFDTDAETVLVGNQQQWSGQSWVDFSSPVEYTLITAGGKEYTVTVSVFFTGLWEDMGSSLSGYSPRIGMFNGVFPFISYLDSYYMYGDYLNLADYSWNNQCNYYAPYSISSNALAIAGNTVFAPTVTDTTLSQIDLFVYYNYASYTPSYYATGNIESLSAYTRNSNEVFVSFINSTDNRAPEIVRFYYDDYDYTFYSDPLGIIEYRPASSLTAAVSGSGVYAAVTYEDDTSSISLYQYGGSWNSLGSLPVSNHIVKGMIFDDWNYTLIIVAAAPNSDSSKTNIKVYSYDLNNSSWESLISPLTLDVSVAQKIEVAWGNESVLVATNQDCYESDEAGWVHLGGGHYYDSPAPYFSITADQNGNKRYIVYTDSTGYNTYLRYVER